MNPNTPLIQAPPGYTPMQNLEELRPWHAQPRARLFGAVFITVLALGLLATALQTNVYASSATVLMTAAMAIDEDNTEASTQRVAIQRTVLLGGQVMSQLLETLQADGFGGVTMAYLRDTLQVTPVEETNLVEMGATGSNADLLPALVNHWIDTYLAIRSAHVEQSQQQTKQVVEDQLADLEVKLIAARQALADYRNTHDISSAERQENEEMARLYGLTQALNRAVEKEIASQAFLETMREAISQGKEVVPLSERAGVEKMKREIAEIDSQLNKLRRNYKADFVARNPEWREIHERRAELAEELEDTLNEGRVEAIDQAEQDWAAAQQSVADLESRLEEQKVRSAEFTTIYATHQALAQDLEKLEALNRDTQSRLVQVEVNQVERYPQVSVIDRPAPESLRIGPDYRLWLGGSTATALLLAILAVWLHGFLGPRQKPTYVTLSGVHMYPGESGTLAPPEQAQALPQDGTPRLHQSKPLPDSDTSSEKRE
ncbi:MAG: hypothetical protein AAGA91_13750 [Pseudomonadota bacterium]